MLELTEKELALGKRLAHVDKTVRDRAVASVRAVLAQKDEFTHMEMLRHWKALFYCFWLSDKPLVQQELSWDLAGLVLVCRGQNRVEFVRAFWETIAREWFDVDKHRIDKFLLLARRIVFFSLQSMRQSGWDEDLVAEYLGMYLEGPIHPTDPKVPNSIRTHVGDVFVDELVRLASDVLTESDDPQAELAQIPVALLLEIFMRFITTSTIRHLPPVIQESVFENMVIRIAEAEERSMKQADSDDDDKGPAPSDSQDNVIAEETLDKVQFLADNIPEIKQRLLAVGGEDTARAAGRKRLHLLYQALCETFPDEQTDVIFDGPIKVRAPVGAEERKAASKHKRRKEAKSSQLKERRKRKADPARSAVDSSAVEFDVNALANEATADERQKYQEDDARVQEMERKFGFEVPEDSKSRPKSKKAKRAAKKATKDQEDVPQLVPIGDAPRPAADPIDERSPWVVRERSSASGARRSVASEKPASLLAEMDRNVVVRDKSAAHTEKAPRAKRRAANGGKRLTWALEQNSVKRFLKKVPMLPSPAPVEPGQSVQLRPALRKRSAYGEGGREEDKSPLKPVMGAQTKKARVSVNGHPSTPVSAKRPRREHARELGNAVPTAPFFFLKPVSSYVASPGKIEIPPGCTVHHEVELGVVIGKGGRDIPASTALQHVAGYALGLDLTARNLQDEAKKKGLPWSAAKGFDTFTPIGPFIPASMIPDPQNVRLWIEVAGHIKQDGMTDAMIFPIPQLLEHVSRVMTLEEGDLVLTGTPKGVGPIQPGEHVVAGLEYQGRELSRIKFDAVSRP
ncbi:hypothetical protein GGF46_000713 [Coemansia sp. RSA 552]|nr:hypothetical protein GGF46_000713 [Coemansia sp. RSA 552]